MDEQEIGIAEPAAEAEPAQPTAEAVAPAASEDHFFDPSQLSPELQGQWKRMQGAYTKKMQNIASYRDAADLVSRFNSDPEFARQTIMQRAQALGLPIGHPMVQGSGQPQSAASQMPPSLVEAVKANLSPELQWMAPALAASQWAGMQMALQPIQQQQQRTVQSSRDEQYEQLAEQLSQKAPGWEEHEEDMTALLSFLQSDKQSDRRFGSKLELLHRLVVGDGQATAEAARRMGQAAKARTVAGAPTAAPLPNIQDQVKKSKTTQDAWDAAAKYAMAEMARQGIKVS